MDIDFEALKPDRNFLVALEEDIWLMDDHRWAFLAWEKHRSTLDKTLRFDLVHADYHWDAIDDIEDDPLIESALQTASLQQLETWTSEDKRPIYYDSFIAPAVRRGYIKTIHWFCKQTESDEGFWGDYLKGYGSRQLFYNTAKELKAASTEKPVIFDLCLDLFNRSNHYYTGDIWSDEEIEEFFDASRHHIEIASCITVSMSFSYSGTESDTRRLTKLAVGKISDFRNGST